jgi:hypothetical protein
MWQGIFVSERTDSTSMNHQHPHSPAIVLTLTASKRLGAYEMTGPTEATHRSAFEHRFGSRADALLCSLANALDVFNASRVQRFVKVHPAYFTGNPAAANDTRAPKHLLNVHLRSASQGFLEACEFLAQSGNDLSGLPSLAVSAAERLRRVSPTFQLIPSADVEPLQRWATKNFQPGQAMNRTPESRKAHRAAIADKFDIDGDTSDELTGDHDKHDADEDEAA